MTYGLMFLRGNSRRIPGKNTKLFMDKPLYQWNAEVMLKSSFVNRLIICTEDTEIKNQVARFLEWPNSATRWLLPRPSILATDTANIIDNINWCLKLIFPFIPRALLISMSERNRITRKIRRVRRALSCRVHPLVGRYVPHLCGRSCPVLPSG